MPPSLRTRASQNAATTTPLTGVTVTISGRFEGHSQNSLEARFRALGASVSRSVGNTTSVLVANEFEYKGKTAKVVQAQSRSLPVVGLDWLDACEEKNNIVPFVLFDYSNPRSPTTAASDGKTDAKGAKKDSKASKAGAKRGADEVTESIPPAKKRATRSKAKDEVKDEEAKDKDDEAKVVDEAPKKRATSAKAKEADAAPTAPSKAEVKEADAPKKAAPTKGRGKKATKAKEEDGKDAEEDAQDAAEAAPASKLAAGKAVDGQHAKGCDVVVPADPYCHNYTGTVYICSETGMIYDAHLNQSNHSANANKFYKVQILVNPTGTEYKTWTRWGRVGEVGAHSMLGVGTLDSAIKAFKAKFQGKTGLTWENRDNEPQRGKYVFAQQNYEETAEELEKKLGSINFHSRAMGTVGADVAEQPSKLEPEVQQLMQLIFNTQYMNAAMTSMKYDARRLPLGKLSKVVITKAYQILKDLTDAINSNGPHSNITALSDQYYTYIPHDFGRQRIPVLNNVAAIKPEIELLDNLVDMKQASDLMTGGGKDDDDLKINKLDMQFSGLGLNEMTVLNPAADEFRLISEYLNDSRGMTHHITYTVEHIFRIERPHEESRLSEFKLPPGAQSDRRLLWHGSRATNFGGILSQGLRIAPPEAPVSGYMFGKGIYLADMSSKSAGYTASSLSGRTGLLLLCEAELGSPMLELVHADYNAGQRAKTNNSAATWGMGRNGPSLWKDAECVHSSLAGIKMPDTSTKPGNTNVPNAGLWYNEYICYDVSQVRLRYLLRVKM